MTPVFTYQENALTAENVSLAHIAQTVGTPSYVYSKAALVEAYQSFNQGFKDGGHLVCFAVKANPSLGVLNVFAALGAGFDIVSGGELARVIAAGGDPKKVVFSGVGKTEQEMRDALTAGIKCFNVESVSELKRLDRVAGDMQCKAPVSLRVNPNVDAKTHPYISTGLKNNKFGVAHQETVAIYQLAASLPNLVMEGIDCHIGSQITEISPFLDAFDRVLNLVDALVEQGINVKHIDLGGGIGICYEDETPIAYDVYAEAILKKLGDRQVQLVFEPGRALVGNAGVLLTQVEYLKPSEVKNFAIVDAAMNDLMRPALYDAFHDIKMVVPSDSAETLNYEIVGPICETGDFLGHDRELPLQEGDLLAVMSAGAYAMSMASNYNTRPRATEVMVDGDQMHIIRQREQVADLFALESVLPAN